MSRLHFLRFIWRAYGIWLSILLCWTLPVSAAKVKYHYVGLGAARTVPYSVEGDPSGALPGETKLEVRPLVVDSKIKEWTTGQVHDVTDRSFTVRRAVRINDALPTDHHVIWVWQKGPWLLVDRTTGRVSVLHLPDYDPSVSQVVWFRDYAAYCGLKPSAKSLFAIVAQIAVRRPVLNKRLGAWSVADHPSPACIAATWQRNPLQVTFAPTNGMTHSFALVGASAVLVEEDDAGGTDSGSGN